MNGIVIDENLPRKLNLPTGLIVKSTRAIGSNPRILKSGNTQERVVS